MEILVYIGVLSSIFVAVLSFLIWSVLSNTKTKVMREALDNGRRAMETITSEVREAKGVYAPTTTANQLSLETTTYLPIGETTTYIDFFLCGTQLCLKKESQMPIAFTSDNVEVGNLTFTQIITGQTPSVEIDLTINYKNPNNRPEYQASVNLKSTVSLRSY